MLVDMGQTALDVTWQPSLLDDEEPAFDAGFASAARRFLGDAAWVDVAPAAVSGADALFAEVLARAPWAQHERPMYDHVLPEPRLTTRKWDDPPPIVREMGSALSARYGAPLGVVSANLYRDGRDSVAWHGDRIGRLRAETVVAILSLGATRRFLLRPKGGGGPSVRYLPRAGDLVVMGGTCQRTWEHSIPKCAEAGPRISIMWREAY